ncbi:MAG: NADH-quinone oxidoreductase subunit L, partial [Ignavibacteriae bacterium]
ALTFHGTERFDHHHVHPHESPKTMTIPLIVLAVLSALGGFLGIPHVLGSVGGLHLPNLIEGWLEPVFAKGVAMLPQHTGDHTSLEFMLMGGSIVLAVAGIMLARSIYSSTEKPAALAQRFAAPYKLLWNKWYVDEIYDLAIVGPILAVSRDFLWKIVDVVLIDGVVNGSGRVVAATSQILRKLQSGIAQNYALLMMVGIVVLIAMVLLPTLR